MSQEIRSVDILLNPLIKNLELKVDIFKSMIPLG